MPGSTKLLYMVVFCSAMYGVALALGYIWARAMHYPFSRRQRVMWVYYVIWMTAIPVLGPFMVASAIWLTSPQTSVRITIALLIIWMVIAWYIVQRMCKPGGRLSQDRQ